jgi:hypothetical protein
MWIGSATFCFLTYRTWRFTWFVSHLNDSCQVFITIHDLLQEYCVNQSTAIQVLKSLRDSNPELASHLQVSDSWRGFDSINPFSPLKQQLRDENPTVRNLDLSSYLLAPSTSPCALVDRRPSRCLIIRW